MPRDLASFKQSSQEPKDKISRDMDKQDHLAEIKPYAKSLTFSDVESSVKLEDATFPPQERATREKVCDCATPLLHVVSLLLHP